MFGLTSNELARRCDIGDLPFLLAVPEATENIRNARKALVMWLQAEQQYSDFIKNDIIELDKKKGAQSRIYRDTQKHAVHLEKGIEYTERDIKILKEEIKKVKNRECAFDKEIFKLKEDIRFIEMDIEMKEQEREDWKQKMIKAENAKAVASCEEQMDEITVSIAKLTVSIPSYKKQIEQITSKKKVITDKKDLVERKTSAVNTYKEELKKAKEEVESSKKHMERIANCLEQLKEIHLCRTSPDVTKKIFFDVPVEAKIIGKRFSPHIGKRKNGMSHDNSVISQLSLS